MHKELVANILAVVGILLMVVAAWLIHPSAGLAVAGVSSLVLGVGIFRSVKHDRSRVE
jgi:hypothetical protein